MKYLDYLASFLDNKEPKEALEVLLEHEFVVVNSCKLDKNRVIDGLSIRNKYLVRYQNDENYAEIVKEIEILPPISCLEVLLALAERIDDELLWDPDYILNGTDYWFWKMVSNLGIRDLRCQNGLYDWQKAGEIIEKWVYRDFKMNGEGSPFPLKNSHTDQRNVQLWYQMCGYINENVPLFNP